MLDNLLTSALVKKQLSEPVDIMITLCLLMQFFKLYCGICSGEGRRIYFSGTMLRKIFHLHKYFNNIAFIEGIKQNVCVAAIELWALR